VKSVAELGLPKNATGVTKILAMRMKSLNVKELQACQWEICGQHLILIEMAELCRVEGRCPLR
jgi:hypothetical protein